ncbi:dnaJ homolog subfamily C member 27 isoform 1-T2 [Cyanocitta cristata]
MEANAAKRKEPRKALRVKVISMGDAEVGKSCIIKRYCEKRFVSKYLATIGIDYGVTKVQIRDREIKVNIFDMAGHPFFYEVRNEFYKDTQGVILVYDVGSKESFDSLDSWLAEMKQELGPHGNMENVVFVVCANKVGTAGGAGTGSMGMGMGKGRELDPGMLGLDWELDLGLSWVRTGSGIVGIGLGIGSGIVLGKGRELDPGMLGLDWELDLGLSWVRTGSGIVGIGLGIGSGIVLGKGRELDLGMLGLSWELDLGLLGLSWELDPGLSWEGAGSWIQACPEKGSWVWDCPGKELGIGSGNVGIVLGIGSGIVLGQNWIWDRWDWTRNWIWDYPGKGPGVGSGIVLGRGWELDPG